MSATREAAPGRAQRGAGVALVVAVVAAAYLSFIGARLVVFDGDPSGFVTAGDQTTDRASAPDSLLVTSGTHGYDGQAYYRLARDPLTTEVTEQGITFTRPAYWQSRIGYPLAAWVVSVGGQGPLVPSAMLLLNLVAVVVLALLAARLAHALGRNPWWGAVPAAWAGYVVGVGQDLTEPLAGALMLGSLSAMRSGRFAIAGVALTAAALTRETTLVLALAVVLASVPSVARTSRAQPGGAAPPWWVGAAPLLVYAGWRAWVGARWAEVVPDPPSDNPLGAPLVELLGHLSHALADVGSHWPNLVLLLPTLAALVIAGTALRFRDQPTHERLALALHLVVLSCLPVWDRGQAYLRWGCEPMLLGWLILLGGRRQALHAPARTKDVAQPGRRDDPALAALAALSVGLWFVATTQSVGYPRVDGVWMWS